MNDSPLVSVIMVVQDGQLFVKDAIESVQKQSYENWELLLLAGGINADNLKVVEACVEQSPAKIRFVESTTNHFPERADLRNLGIRNALGEFVAFLDAEDLWLPEKLAEQLELLEKEPAAAMVYGRTLIWHSWTGRSEDEHMDYYSEHGVQPNQLIDAPNLLPLLLQNKYQTATISDALIRRAVLNFDAPFVEELPMPFSDYAFFVKMELNHPCYVSDRNWLRCRYRSTGVSATEHIEDAAQRQQFLQWVQAYLGFHNVQHKALWHALQEQLANYAVSDIRQLIQEGFPALTVNKIDFLGDGLNNRAYRINDAYIFRFPKHAQAEQALRSEIAILRQIEGSLPLRVPLPTWIGNKSWLRHLISITKEYLHLPSKSYQKPVKAIRSQHAFVGYPEIRGSFLYPAFVAQATAELQGEMAQILGSFFAALHSTSLSEIQKLGLPKHLFSQAYYVTAFEAARHTLIPTLSSDEVEKFNQLFTPLFANSTFYDYAPVLLHGDVNWDHILFDEAKKKIVGVIDFGGVSIGDPAYDFVGLWHTYGDEFVTSILAAYGAEHPQHWLNKIKLLHCCDTIYLLCAAQRADDETEMLKGRQMLTMLLGNIRQVGATSIHADGVP